LEKEKALAEKENITKAHWRLQLISLDAILKCFIVSKLIFKSVQFQY